MFLHKIFNIFLILFQFKIRFYTSLPLNALSKFVGFLAKIEIPLSLRETVYGSFIYAYSCRMDEVKEESLHTYRSFSEFFNRELKPETRPISNSILVCILIKII